MTLSGIYRRSVIFPAIFLVIFTVVYSSIENRNYESEWITKEAAVETDILAAVIYCALICLLSLTMFLNKISRVGSSNILSFLSWFLLPVGVMCVVSAQAINEYNTVESSFESLMALIFNLPFVIGLTWGYIKFKRSLGSMPT